MPGREPFAYAVVRVVPRIERGECLNAGVLLFCRTKRFLEVRAELDRDRLRALAPACDPVVVEAHLDGMRRVAAGDRASGPIAQLPASERFHWLAAPSSTMIQCSPVHTGLLTEPRETLDRLFAELVG